MHLFRRGTPSSLQTWGRSSFGVDLRFRGDKLLASETRLLIEDRVLLAVRFINKTTIPRHSRERSRDRSRIKETMFCSSRIDSKAFSSHVNGGNQTCQSLNASIMVSYHEALPSGVRSISTLDRPMRSYLPHLQEFMSRPVCSALCVCSKTLGLLKDSSAYRTQKVTAFDRL
jgi:hypothetical protein